MPPIPPADGQHAATARFQSLGCEGRLAVLAASCWAAGRGKPAIAMQLLKVDEKVARIKSTSMRAVFAASY